MAAQAGIVIRSRDGATYDLGVAKMRLLTAAADSSQLLSIAEFAGGEGPWTIPHVHQKTAESFFVLDGSFTFTISGQTFEAGPGDYILVPPGTKHVLGGGAGGGTTLVTWAPAGLEEMFIELSRLSPDAIRDPAVRAEIASRHDSVPA